MTSPTSDSNLVEGNNGGGGGSSTDDDNRTDEFVDLLSIDDNDEVNLLVDSDPTKTGGDDFEVDVAKCDKQSISNSRLVADMTLLTNPAVSTNRLDRIMIDDDDVDVDLEFENYLNDQDEDNSSSEPNENDRVKLEKLKRLDEIECTFENYELLQKMAIERYGLLNKRLRRRIWPILILYRNRFFKSEPDTASTMPLQDMIESTLNRFNKIS